MNSDEYGIIDIAGEEYLYEHLVLGHYFVLDAKNGAQIHRSFPIPIPSEKKFTLVGYKIQANGESLDHSDEIENRFWINVSKKNDLDGKHRFGGDMGHAIFPYSENGSGYPSDRQFLISALAPPMETLEIEFNVKSAALATNNVRIRAELSILLLTKVQAG